MGASYGSVQIRCEDRGPVLVAVARLAGATARFLVGPPLNGWVGVYPQRGEFEAAGDLARALSGQVLAVVIYDDDFLAYEYYRDGQLVDRYNSRPDYFEKVSDEERRALRGRPETFAHLAADAEAFAALTKTLAGQAVERAPFASDLLEAFAAALGIRNAMTAHEYLTEHEETDDVEGWDQFVHFPDLTPEHARQRAAGAALRDQKQRLRYAGLLLAEHGSQPGEWSVWPRVCPAPDGRGFLVAWSDHAAASREPRPLDYYGPPWSAGPVAAPPALPPSVHTLALSPSGRYLAVGHAAGDWRATLWDLATGELVAETPQVRAVGCVGFLPDESACFSVSSDGGDGKVLIQPIGPGKARGAAIGRASRAAAHPSGGWLAVADESDGVFAVNTATGAVEWAARLAAPRIRCLRFSPSGESLWVARDGGVCVYARDDLSAGGGSPRPTLSVAVGQSVFDSVTDLAYDPAGGRVLFAVTDGTVRFLDLASATVGVLLDPPGRPLITQMVLSGDGSTLAVVSNPNLMGGSHKRSGPPVQFWNYPALTPVV